MRSQPSSATSIIASSVRTPPAALSLTCGGDGPPHQPKVVHGGPSRAKASRGLDVIGAHVAADLAEANFLFVVQVAVLEDHLDDRTAVVSGLGHAAMSERDGVPLAANRLADVDDHVELGRPVGHGPLGFEDLHRRRMSAVRETRRSSRPPRPNP